MSLCEGRRVLCPLVLFALMCSVTVVAAQSSSFTLTGVLRDRRGYALCGTQQITFAIYAQPKGEEPLWVETQNVPLDESGRFRVELGKMFRDGRHSYLFTGSVTSIENSDGRLWAGIRVGQGAEQAERLQLTTVQPPSTPVPADLFGMHILDVNSWPAVNIGALGKPGWTFADIEQSQGVYDWSVLDQKVNAALAHGISMYYSNTRVPPWAATQQGCPLDSYGIPACTATVSNMQYWTDFVTNLVTRYKGQIGAYELWNEPDTWTFSGTTADMVTLTQNEYSIIRSIDPAALIISPSYIKSKDLDAYWAAGGVKTVDVVSVHIYPSEQSPEYDTPESIGDVRLTNIRTTMLKYGVSTPVWETESSWGHTPPAITDPDARAAFVPRHYILHWSNDVVRHYWFEWDSSDYGQLWDPVTGLSKAALALEQTENWLIGSTMLNSCSMNGGTTFSAVYTCDFVQSNGSAVRVVWNTNGDSTYTAPSQYKHYQDLLGNTYTIPASQQVTIGYKPILLEP